MVSFGYCEKRPTLRSDHENSTSLHRSESLSPSGVISVLVSRNIEDNI